MITMIERFKAVSGDESGFTTAELLGNAALGIAALVVIWGLLGTMGKQLMDKISGELGIGG